MADLSELLESARKLQPELIDLRRRIHAEPELGLELPETRAKVLEAISDLDLEVELSERTGGVVATLRGAKPGRTILLRADMDALPMPEDTDLPFKSRREGAMHACGHDAHTAMLAGAARLLCERRDRLAGNVLFMFQPGEEGHFGARAMVEEGLLERDPAVDAAFAIHVTPFLAPGWIAARPGPVLASADVFAVDITGKGGHASMPHDAVDPIPVACEIVQALQTFVTRRVHAFEPVVLTVTKIEAGTTTNVIPESAKLLGTLRSVSEDSRRRAHEGIRRVASRLAEAHEVEAAVHVVEGYPATVNDADFVQFALRVGKELLGDGRAIEMPFPIMGAEDFSFVLERVPGAMVFMGMKPDGVAEPAPNHSNRLLLNEEGLAYGAALHTAIALRYLGA
jgi:hippurate hydrolase